MALGVIVFAARLRIGDQPALAWSPGDIKMKVLYSLGGVACFAFAERPLRFALGIASLLATGMLMSQGQVLHRERSFFGTIRVIRVEPGPYHQLIHGNTLHGQQSLDPGRSREPLTYFHRTGPIGQVFDVLGKRANRLNVAIVGLGTGSLAAYAQSDSDGHFMKSTRQSCVSPITRLTSPFYAIVALPPGRSSWAMPASVSVPPPSMSMA